MPKAQAQTSMNAKKAEIMALVLSNEQHAGHSVPLARINVSLHLREELVPMLEDGLIADKGTSMRFLWSTEKGRKAYTAFRIESGAATTEDKSDGPSLTPFENAIVTLMKKWAREGAHYACDFAWSLSSGVPGSVTTAMVTKALKSLEARNLVSRVVTRAPYTWALPSNPASSTANA